MKRMGLFLLAVVTVALMFSGSALAQAAPGDNSFYFVTYYSNNVAGAPDATVRLVNDGDTSSDLYAGIFVFDDSQEMQACGYCLISPDGLLSEDVKTELTNNPLTGRVPTRGVIKIVSTPVQIGVSGGVPGLRGWATHIQRATPTSGTYATTEAPLADSNLTPTEAGLLDELCYFILDELGSGQGTITCTLEDHDF